MYESYTPIDLCINNNDIYVLVIPNSLLVNSGLCVLHFDLNGTLINEFDFVQIKNSFGFSAISFFNDFIYITTGEIIKKIDSNSGESDDIHIPITNDKPYLLVTDMEVESEESIYFTGPGPWRFETHIYITNLDCIKEESQTFYSNSRIFSAAMPNNPGLTTKDNRYIYLATFLGRSLEIYNKENELILQEEIKPKDLEETLPIDVAINKDDIYIVDYENNEVHIYHEE